MMTSRFFIVLLSFASLAISFCELKASPIHRIEGAAQGTTYHLSYSGAFQKDLETKVHAALADFDKIFSNYRPDSEISLVNAQETSAWIPLSPRLYELIAFSLLISAETEGSFDITLGQQLKAWGFGAYPKTSKVPSAEAIAEALKNSGYQQVELREHPPALRKKNPKILIDLSGIAQGQSVDEIAALFRASRISSYIVEIGGELIAKGERSPGKSWTVGIDRPDSQSEVVQTLPLRDQALSTSGDSQNFFEDKGQRYAHIFDPRQGRPVQSKVASVSILADTCRQADAFTKAFLMLSHEKREILARKHKLSALILLHEAKSYSSVVYGAFPLAASKKDRSTTKK